MIGCGLAVDGGAAFDDQQGGVVAGGRGRGELGACVEVQVGHDDGGIGLGWACYAVHRSRDHVYLALVVWQGELCDLIGRDGLVVGFCELVLFGKIDPELHHFEGAALL